MTVGEFWYVALYDLGYYTSKAVFERLGTHIPGWLAKGRTLEDAIAYLQEPR